MEKIFNSKNEIELLHSKADNAQDTRYLINKFRELKTKRKEFYLNLEEIDKIFKWKLRTQFGRQSKHRQFNTNENIALITKTAFSVTHENEEYETKLKLKLLTSISGVQVPVASAILTICYPDKYSVIDYRNWRQIYKTKEKKTNYTFNEYIDYLSIVRKMAKEFGLTPQEIDYAIWQKDKEENSN